MRKFVNPIPGGGAPLSTETVDDLVTTEIWDAIESTYSEFEGDTEGIIISGCIISGSVGNYNISAGFVFLNGEIMRLPSQTGVALPQYIVPVATSYETAIFNDGDSKNLIEVKVAGLAVSAPGAGQYIAITTTTDPDNRRLNTVRGENIGCRIKLITVSDWDMDTDPNYTVNHNLTDSDILSVSVMIEDGIVGKFHDLFNAGTITVNSTDLELTREGSGQFDDPGFVNTTIKITILYRV
jgi:hypothetical protein